MGILVAPRSSRPQAEQKAATSISSIPALRYFCLSFQHAISRRASLSGGKSRAKGIAWPVHLEITRSGFQHLATEYPAQRVAFPPPSFNTSQPPCRSWATSNAMPPRRFQYERATNGRSVQCLHQHYLIALVKAYRLLVKMHHRSSAVSIVDCLNVKVELYLAPLQSVISPIFRQTRNG